MKIIAGVHTAYGGDDARSTARRCASARPATRATPASAWCTRNSRIVPRPVGRRERASRRAATQPLRPRRLARPCAATPREHLQRLGIDVDPRTPMGALPLGLQQLVEIARVLFSGARIIILDEPTSALSPPEVERLFALLRRRARGRAQLRLHLALPRRRAAISDTRHGVPQRPADRDRAGAPRIDKRWIIERMIGAGHDELEESYTGDIALRQPARGAGGAADARPRRASARSRTCRSQCAPARCWASTASSARASSSWRARCSAGRRRSAGACASTGAEVRLRNTAAARRAGMAFVPESRRAMLFHHEPVFKNISISILERISRLWLRPGSRAHASRASMCSGCTSGRRWWTGRSARSPAATSRRWRWRGG